MLPVSKECQAIVFELQIEMAMDFHKPLVLHLRGDVLQDARQILKEKMVS